MKNIYKMISLFVVLLFSSFSLSGCNNKTTEIAPGKSSEQIQITHEIAIPVFVRNNTGSPIYELYISSASHDEWGEELLKGNPIQKKEYYEGTIYFENKNDVIWDIASVDDFGKVCYYYDLDLSRCNSKSITITLVQKNNGIGKATAK